MVKNYSNAASTLAETAAVVSEDLRAFLTSDSSELPQSLRQLNKLLQSSELQETVSTVTASVVRGVTSATAGSTGGPPLVDTIIEAVLSDRGRGLVGMAVGVAMRNATAAVCEFVEHRMEAATSGPDGSGVSLGVKDILDILSSDQGEKIMTLLLTQSIRTAVTSYVDSTAGYNLYNDMLSSLVKQEHRDALTDLISRITASFCREAALSYRRAAAAGAATSMASTAPHAANHASKYTSAGSSSAGNTTNILSGRSDGASASGGPASTSSSGPASSAVTAAASCVGNEGSMAVVEAGRAPGSLPLVKSNGQLVAGGGQNVRPTQGSQLHKQHSLSGANALSATGCNTATGALTRALLAQAPPPWLRQVVELVRERDIRSLAVDVVSCASREATRGAVEGFLQSSGASVSGSCANAVLVVPPCVAGYKLYVLATLAVSLCMYALSPGLMVL